MAAESLITLLAVLTCAATACIYLLRASRLADTLNDARRQANTDRLTNLLNRGAFYTELRAAFDAGLRLHVVYIDLANFKDVNDTAGHEAGDRVLETVSRLMIANAPENSSVARMGGDEFCILLPDTSTESAETLCETLYSGAKSIRSLPDGVSRIELSIGLASLTEDCSSAEELLRRADRAMYHAKQEKQGPEIYAPNLDDAVRIRREIRNELGDAFRSGKLQLAYQPLVDARTGHIAGAEALLRWPDKIGRAGSPAEFIPIAEETGLIVEIGEWVIREALQQIKHLKTVPIAVNASTRQFLDSDFYRVVADAILDAGVDPKLLKIEITESVLITHTDAAARIIRELRDIGVQVLLDDFGTGYSSLSYIQKFSFDMLKIDRAFVRAMDKSQASGDLLRAIVNMGHSLNMKVVAEGVETRRQAARLDELGVDYLQGFALGAPAAPEKLEGFDRSEFMLSAKAMLEQRKAIA